LKNDQAPSIKENEEKELELKLSEEASKEDFKSCPAKEELKTMCED